MVVGEGDQPIPGVGVVVSSDLVVMLLDRLRGTRSTGKNRVDLAVQHVIDHRVELERTAAYRSCVGTNEGDISIDIGIENLPEHKKIGLANGCGLLQDVRTPVQPET